MRRAPGYLADFDSASAMVRALARHLHGEGFRDLGLPHSQWLRPFATATNYLPEPARQEVYARGGWMEAASPRKVGEIDAEDVSRWVAGAYPERRFPAVMIGSSNGALTHLAAALGIPWLPQTFLFAIRHSSGGPDEPRASMAEARPLGEALLRANPDLQLHHMDDPNQDRLMLQHMTYFRVKRRRLGPAYEAFLRERLAPGGTIFLVECRRDWPVTRVGDRYVFQFGGLGGIPPEEYLHGSERVAAFLERDGSKLRRWDPPQPDETAPEAEWGFAPEMGEDVARMAETQGWRLVRIVFDQPEDPSPLVADLYRWWSRRTGEPGNRLVASSFVLMAPRVTLRTGAVPFWCKFPVQSSADALEDYLRTRDAFEQIGIMLFSHGISSVGVAPIERWRALLELATSRGEFLGVDEERYPADFAAFGRYHQALERWSERPLPEPLALTDLEAFLAEGGDRYRVEWRG